MKALLKVIRQRVAEALAAGDDLQELFIANIPKKGLSEKWLLKTLEKQGPRLLTVRAWIRSIPIMDSPGILSLTTVSDLANHLGMSPAELAWFADLHRRNPAHGPLQHYRYRWIPKRKGSPRLLMEPKESLKMTQRRLLETILNDIPIHEAAHGFVRGRSIRTFAEIHTRQPVVLRMDLADFFQSITFCRVAGIFKMAGYRKEVANLLAGLTTHAPPRAVARLDRHLPQGAPSSPALANATSYRLDCRLAGLARSAGLNYSRYADDLAFSGPRIRESFAHLVGGIALEEGFRINHRKTTFMGAATRQSLAGVVVNEHPNCDRRTFDRLKAILHNCAKHGPASQGMADRQSHLRGKIAAVGMLNPPRGKKLLAIFERIQWDL